MFFSFWVKREIVRVIVVLFLVSFIPNYSNPQSKSQRIWLYL